MIATQTKALLLDAYRDLNARKMFWVVLILNVLVIAGFGALGIRNGRLSVLTWELPLDIPLPEFVYKWIFSSVIVGKWLTWAATILALISTASIFPDFMAGGTIDLYLSKPISRLRLFFMKFLTGLLFVALQVTVFTVGGLIVLRTRGGIWEPGLLLAIPIVVLFYSYLFSICVLLGVLTRSTLAALFLTIVAWFGIFGLNQTDRFLIRMDDIYAQRTEDAQQLITRLDLQIGDIQSRLKPPTTAPPTPPAATNAATPSPAPPSVISADTKKLGRLTRERGRAASGLHQQPPSWARSAQPVIFALNTLVPKTQETVSLLDRVLFTDLVLNTALNTAPDDGPMHGWRGQIQGMLYGRSIGWILGSSLAFEAVVLSLASWLFCRKDF